jgi:hypothetical protein
VRYFVLLSIGVSIAIIDSREYCGDDGTVETDVQLSSIGRIARFVILVVHRIAYDSDNHFQVDGEHYIVGITQTALQHYESLVVSCHGVLGWKQMSHPTPPSIWFIRGTFKRVNSSFSYEPRGGCRI